MKKGKQTYFSDKFDANKKNKKKFHGVINKAFGRQSGGNEVSEVLVNKKKITNKGNISNAF